MEQYPMVPAEIASSSGFLPKRKYPHAASSLLSSIRLRKTLSVKGCLIRVAGYEEKYLQASIKDATAEAIQDLEGMGLVRVDDVRVLVAVSETGPEFVQAIIAIHDNIHRYTTRYTETEVYDGQFEDDEDPIGGDDSLPVGHQTINIRGRLYLPRVCGSTESGEGGSDSTEGEVP